MTETLTDAPLVPSVENILNVYRNCEPRHIAEGMEWYNLRHELACELSPDNPSQAAGVIAALSPMLNWSRNVQLAREAYATNGELGRVGLMGNVAKANRIVKGELAGDVLGGNKVRSFWQSIADPSDPNVMAVIDRHAHDIAVGRRCKDSERKLSSTKRYREFADAYAIAANEIGIGAAQLQAITWVAWREWNGIVED